jgi:hypothetical protein
MGEGATNDGDRDEEDRAGTSNVDVEPPEVPFGRLEGDGTTGIGEEDIADADTEESEVDDALVIPLRSYAPGRAIAGIFGDESVAAELRALDGRRARPGLNAEGGGCWICDEGVEGLGRETGVEDRSETAEAAYARDMSSESALRGEGGRREREAGRGAGAMVGTCEENCDDWEVRAGVESSAVFPFV